MLTMACYLRLVRCNSLSKFESCLNRAIGGPLVFEIWRPLGGPLVAWFNILVINNYLYDQDQRCDPDQTSERSLEVGQRHQK